MLNLELKIKIIIFSILFILSFVALILTYKLKISLNLFFVIFINFFSLKKDSKNYKI